MKNDLIYGDLTYAIRSCLMEVYNKLGPGFREETYKKAVIEELNIKGLSVLTEHPIQIIYRDKIIDEYRLDLIVEGKVILEIKAVAELHPRFEAQLLSYLKASQVKIGLLVNFGSDKLFIKRLVSPYVQV
ncbi:MAG: GxxExxY protein [bacterium]